MVLKLLMEVKRRLNLHEGAKFGVVVLDVVATLLILLDEGVLPAHRDVVDAHIGVVTAAQFDFVDVVEINYVQLFLLLVIVFWGVNLE